MTTLRKELAIYDVDNESNSKKLESVVDNNEGLFVPKPYQMISLNFMHPTLGKKTLLINWQTGFGKTYGSLDIAAQFIELSAKQNKSGVIICGFSSNVFKKDMLKFKDLGLIPNEYIEKYENAPEEGKTKIANKIFKLLENGKLGNTDAFVTLFGPKYLYQRLFEFQGKDIKIESYDDLINNIKEGNIKVNKAILKKFENALLIYDELHNLYTGNDYNTWGYAINYVLKEIPSLSAVFLTATPISNSSIEIVYLLNFLSKDKKMITKEDIFNEDGSIKESGKDLIRSVSYKKVSYFRKLDESFPKSSFSGINIPLIPKIKFRLAKVAEKYEASIRKFGSVSVDNATDLNDENKGIMDDIIVDIDGNVYHSLDSIKKLEPNNVIEFKKDYSIGRNTLKIKEGFDEKTMAPKFALAIDDIFELIKNKNKNGKIIIYQNRVINNGIMFTKQLLERRGFLFYGNKPTDDTVCKNCGKLKKEHSEKIKMLDVSDFLLVEITEAIELKKSLYLKSKRELNDSKLTQLPSEGKFFIYEIKNNKASCIFSPAIFVTLSADSNTTEILKAFNDKSNMEGDEILILIGSIYIKESIDFNNIRGLLVLSRPFDISSLIQIIGRTVRNKSHALLPKSKRDVTIFLYVNSFFTEEEAAKMKIEEKDLTPELLKYKEKMKNFLIFKDLERLLYENSINDFAYEKKSDYGFDELVLEKKEYDKVDDVGFNLLYGKQELNNCKRIIKTIFLENEFVKYSDLRDMVKGFYDKYNWNSRTEWIDDDTINCALYELCYFEDKKYVYIDGKSNQIKTQNASILSSDNRIIKNGENCHIIPIIIDDEQYFQLVKSTKNGINITSFKIKKKEENVLYNVDLNTKKEELTDAELITSLRNINLFEHYININKEDKLRILKLVIDDDFLGKDNLVKKADYDTYLKLFVCAVFFNDIEISYTKESEKMLAKTVVDFLDRDLNVSSFGLGSKFMPSRIMSVYKYFNELSGKTRKDLSFIHFEKIILGDIIYFKDASDGSWIEQFRHSNDIENDVVIGYFDYKKGEREFKLREPIHKLKLETDSRKRQGGTYYKHVAKEILIDYILKLDQDDFNYDKDTLNSKKVVELGEDILLRILLKREANSKDVRYFYLTDITK